MTLTFLRAGPALVVQLAGTLGAGSDLEGLRASVGRPRGPGVRAVLVDLTQVARLDGLGIGELIRLRRQVRSSGLEFGLVYVPFRQRRLLAAAGLLDVLSVHDDTTAALASLRDQKPAPARSQAAQRGLVRFSPGRDRLGVRRGTGLAML